MKKALFLIITLSCIIAFLAFQKTTKKFHPLTSNNKLPIIAITQIIEHPALDAERMGIIEALQNAGFKDGKNIKIIYKNAQGNISTSAQIAQSLVAENPAVLVAISTPSAQSSLKICAEKNIPLVFAAVNDPLEAKLITTLQQRPEAVTGVSNAVPAELRLRFIRELIPHLKKLAVIYNPGEVNSSNIVKLLKSEGQKYGIEIIEATANKTSEIDGAMKTLVGKADALYIPDDNTAASSIATIVKIGVQERIPIFSCDTSLLDSGLVATYGSSHFALGKLAGEMVTKILKGTPAGQILVPQNLPDELIINQKAVKNITFELPQVFQKDTKFYSGIPK